MSSSCRVSPPLSCADACSGVFRDPNDSEVKSSISSSLETPFSVGSRQPSCSPASSGHRKSCSEPLHCSVFSDENQEAPLHDYAFFEWNYQDTDAEDRQALIDEKKQSYNNVSLRKTPTRHRHKRFSTLQHRVPRESRRRGIHFPLRFLNHGTSSVQPTPSFLLQQQQQRQKKMTSPPTIEDLMVSSIHKSESARRAVTDPAHHNTAAFIKDRPSLSGGTYQTARFCSSDMQRPSGASTSCPLFCDTTSLQLPALRHTVSPSRLSFERAGSPASRNPALERKNEPCFDDASPYMRQWSGPELSSIPLRRFWTRLRSKLGKGVSMSSAPSGTLSFRSRPMP